MYPSRATWSPLTKLIVVLVILVIAGYLLTRFGHALVPLILAAVIAYIFTPAVDALQRLLKLPRVVAILIIDALVIAAAATALSLAIPPLVAQIKEVTSNLDTLTVQVNQALSQPLLIGGLTINPQAIFDQFSGPPENLLQPVFGSTFTVVKSVVSSLVWVVFIAIVSLYLIKDSAKLKAWTEQLAPPAYRDDFIYVRDEINRIWGAFFRGQLTLALVVMLIWSTAGVLIGLRYALVLGLFAGLLEFLPSVGHGIWMVTAASIAIFTGSAWLPVPNLVFMLLVVGLQLIFQQVDLNYLIPRIIGRSVHLPPLVVILGIVAGASLAGFLGIFLAAPTIASLRVLGRYVYAHLVGEETPKEDVTTALPPPELLWWRKHGRGLPKTNE